MPSPSRPSTSTSVRPPSHDVGFVVSVPPLAVSAGAGGARLSIRLLLATELVLPAGQLQVLHDPVGLTGDRLLAHVYHAFARPQSDPAKGENPVAPALRWLVVQAPLAQLWTVTDTLAERAWRPRPEPAGGQLPTRPPGSRVAERAPVRHAAGPESSSRGILLLSESGRRDALAPHAAARLLTRAIRRRWSVLAVTRDGPISLADGRSLVAAPPWRQHLVCRNGALVPVRGEPC